MGTYTTNYNLFMPTVGETGWGTLVNTNFSTIDTTMKALSNRITAVENEVNGALNCTSVTTSGKITGNGGIAGTTGTFSGAVTTAYIGLTGKIVTSATNITYATCEKQSVTIGNGNTDYTLTVNNYSVSSLPKKIVEGVYITKLSNSVTTNLSTRTLTINNNRNNYCTVTVTRKDTSESITYSMNSYTTQTVSMIVGKTYIIRASLGGSTLTATIPAGTTYYLSVPTS